ncbi:carbon-nitrogen hydrolase family protein [Rhodovibrionaceae bacterium A322]
MSDSANGSFKAACVQFTTGDQLGANISMACEAISRAAAAGADLILTPENTTMMTPSPEITLANARPEEEHPGLAAFRDLAAQKGIWLVPGSLTIKLTDSKAANRSYLINPSGDVVASYDKIHMFDVDIPDGQTYRESETFQPGTRAVLADLPWGKLGMTICYDMRFGTLYRTLAKAGASFLAAPAAFTHFTGKAHWHTLLTARAIENGCFVFAPGQCGTHPGDRKTFGHSLIIAPWGEVLADAGSEPGFVIADIDTAKVTEARNMVPSLSHDRMFAAPDLEGDTRLAGLRA